MNLQRLAAAAALFTLSLLVTAPAVGQPLGEEGVPDPLKPWVPWVLYGSGEKACPFLYNEGSSSLCAWPSSLVLDLTEKEGSFSQSWEMSLEGWASLPGDAAHWPERVTVDGKTATVTEGGGAPRVFLPPGRHLVEGVFKWVELPESLPIPRGSGLVELSLNGVTASQPVFDRNGHLWLQRKVKEAAVEERLEVEVARLIRDTIPLELVTRIRLRVSGTVREIVVPGLVSGGFIPLSLKSALPARVEPDGSLRLQVRPGDWVVELGSRHRGPVSTLSSEPPPPPWPREEIWVFEAMNHLRVVEAGGSATSIDPQQTTLPDQWKVFPAYLVRPGEEIVLKEVRRGDPEPAPDRLALNRTIWLFMDGSGYAFRDRINGVKKTNWRLEAREPLDLGRVTVNGREQFITRREGTGLAGIELRQGNVELQAESTMSREGGRLPAVGWEQDFSTAQGVLNLPPGWKLFSLSGADRVSNTWINRWTLLDLFLVLIFSLSIGKLWNRKIGLLALATFVLTYHEPGAPRWMWANFLIASALIRVIPKGRFRIVIGTWLNLLIAGLLVIVVPFTVREARNGIFPQLERPGIRLGIPLPGIQQKGAVMNVADLPSDMDVAILQEAPSPERQSAERRADRYRGGKFSSLSKVQKLAQYDPNAAVQTGKGLPEWQWQTVSFSWTGPVERTEQLTLRLVGPRANLAIAFLRIALLYLLLLALVNVRYSRAGGFDVTGLRIFKPTAVLLLPLLLAVLPSPLRAASIPDREILAELQRRLLAPAECLPACADIPVMKLRVTPSLLVIELELHAAADLAVPLPAAEGQWMPSSISADGKPARGVMRRKGQLLFLAREGKTLLEMSGPLPAQETVQLPLPLRPHRAEVSIEGWVLEGIHRDGKVDGQLQLRRLAERAGHAPGKLQAGALPPRIEVERTLNLGLNQVVNTVVRRMSPAGVAVVIEVPLLSGESVTTEGVRTERGKVLVSMGSSAETFGWSSILGQEATIVLEAPATDEWTEVWRVNASPIWHLEASGIPVIHHQYQNRWLPEWRPWPGEKVELSLSRPAGVTGQTVTIDKSHIRFSPGRRATEAHLNLSLRSSQGGQHLLSLPPGAELLEVKLGGRSQPIRKDGDTLPLPVSPGQQTVDIRWRMPTGMKALFRPAQPGLAIGSVNVSIEMAVPGNRWVLMTGGPTLGPAVLWWGVLVVIVILAVILGRIPGSPLGTFSWFLLGLGLSQATIISAFVVATWLIALRLRRQYGAGVATGTFALMQIALAALTLGALFSLVYAISKGLLGYPSLQIAGNGSSASILRWYSDRSAEVLPAVWTLSAPMYVYRLLMLAWSLWIAFALLKWLRYGWEAFSAGGTWKELNLRKKRKNADYHQTSHTVVDGADADGGGGDP